MNLREIIKRKTEKGKKLLKEKLTELFFPRAKWGGYKFLEGVKIGNPPYLSTVKKNFELDKADYIKYDEWGYKEGDIWIKYKPFNKKEYPYAPFLIRYAINIFKNTRHQFLKIIKYINSKKVVVIKVVPLAETELKKVDVYISKPKEIQNEITTDIKSFGRKIRIVIDNKDIYEQIVRSIKFLEVLNDEELKRIVELKENVLEEIAEKEKEDPNIHIARTINYYSISIIIGLLVITAVGLYKLNQIRIQKTIVNLKQGLEQISKIRQEEEIVNLKQRLKEEKSLNVIKEYNEKYIKLLENILYPKKIEPIEIRISRDKYSVRYRSIYPIPNASISNGYYIVDESGNIEIDWLKIKKDKKKEFPSFNIEWLNLSSNKKIYEESRGKERVWCIKGKTDNTVISEYIPLYLQTLNKKYPIEFKNINITKTKKGFYNYSIDFEICGKPLK